MRAAQYPWEQNTCYEPPPTRKQRRASKAMRVFLILAVLAVIGGVLAFAAGIQAPQI